jgi:HEPN domain-containing protein
MLSRNQGEIDKLDRWVNSYATQSFRDQADRDYIAARLACRYELFPQFLWASQQAIEKYLKAILLYNRIEAKDVGHKINKALALTQKLSFAIDLSDRTLKFLGHLAEVGEYRYIDVPYDLEGHVLVDLDLAVWEVRRYCQVLNVFGKSLPPNEQVLLDKAYANLAKSTSEPRHKFRIHGGLIEKILSDRKHPSRSALLWQNATYGVRFRSTVRVKPHFYGENSMLYLYPEMLDELLKYIKISGALADRYRALLKQFKNNPETRP